MQHRRRLQNMYHRCLPITKAGGEKKTEMRKNILFTPSTITDSNSHLFSLLLYVQTEFPDLCANTISTWLNHRISKGNADLGKALCPRNRRSETDMRAKLNKIMMRSNLNRWDLMSLSTITKYKEHADPQHPQRDKREADAAVCRSPCGWWYSTAPPGTLLHTQARMFPKQTPMQRKVLFYFCFKQVV